MHAISRETYTHTLVLHPTPSYLLCEHPLTIAVRFGKTLYQATLNVGMEPNTKLYKKLPAVSCIWSRTALEMQQFKSGWNPIESHTFLKELTRVEFEILTILECCLGNSTKQLKLTSPMYAHVDHGDIAQRTLDEL